MPENRSSLNHRPWEYKSSRTWLNIPIDGLLDVARIYALVVPLFLVASLVEFLLA
jgi:hypothetical protein